MSNNKINTELSKAFNKIAKKYGYTPTNIATTIGFEAYYASIKNINYISGALGFSDKDRLTLLRTHERFNDDKEYLKSLDLNGLVRQLRMNAGYTAEEFADKAGCSRKTIDNIEATDHSTIGRKLFVKIRTAFAGEEKKPKLLLNLRKSDIELLDQRFRSERKIPKTDLSELLGTVKAKKHRTSEIKGIR